MPLALAPVAAARFLRLLRAALEASDRQLMVVATLRSDFLGEFQTHPFLHDPAYDHDFAYQTPPPASHGCTLTGKIALPFSRACTSSAKHHLDASQFGVSSAITAWH